MERKALCQTCRFNVLLRFVMAGVPRENRGCWYHIVLFPNALSCVQYEREAGAD